MPFCGHPLIFWSIDAGLNSQFVDTVVVSTENEEIRDIAIRSGANEVVKRPAELAGDEVPMVDVLIHSVETLEAMGESFDWIVLLQPTSPLRTSMHIDNSCALIEQKHGLGAVGVCKTDHPVEWTSTLSDDGFMDKFFETANLLIPSHNCSTRYVVNGAIYICRVDLLLKEKTLFLKQGVLAYVMNRYESVDIDDKYDFEIAEFFMNNHINQKR
jgi:CMP-N-acetylneuraminic acid synthetase